MPSTFWRFFPMKRTLSNIGKNPTSHRVLKADWEPDKVYLYQFNRAKCIPSVSPYCLKLETWLRMAGLRYENIKTDILRNTSHKGKLPFIELNGEQIADSVFIIQQLKLKFEINLEGYLSEREKAIGRSVESMVEDKLLWCTIYDRSKSLNEIFHDTVFGPSMQGVLAYLKPLVKVYFHNKLQSHGMGQHSQEEVDHIGIKCLDSLDALLDSNRYLMGDKPTRYDATLFGHLGQIAYVPVKTNLQAHMMEKNPHIIRYVDQIKMDFWPDWEECTKKLQMNTEHNL